MTNFWGEKRKLKEKKAIYQRKNPARFQLENESAPARLGTFKARARSSRKNPARTHHYYLPLIILESFLFDSKSIFYNL